MHGQEKFEIAFEDIELFGQNAVVRPTHLSILQCRYALLSRNKRCKNYGRKSCLLVLIHEGVGKVIYDPSGKFNVGEMVVMVPNIPAEKNDVIAEKLSSLI